jgi:hypothetical protein
MQQVMTNKAVQCNTIKNQEISLFNKKPLSNLIKVFLLGIIVIIIHLNVKIDMTTQMYQKLYVIFIKKYLGIIFTLVVFTE